MKQSNRKTQQYLTLSVVLILLFMLTGLRSPYQSVFYIDPENTRDVMQTGSREHPWSDWQNVKWIEGGTYLQKRGTQYFARRPINPGAGNVTMDAYGEGTAPVIRANGKFKIIESNRGPFSLKNYEIKCDDVRSLSAISHWYTGPLIIENCKIHHSYWGIRLFHCKEDIRITNTVISDTWDDGIFAQNIGNIELTSCHISDVNQGYFMEAEVLSGGDCIQVAGNQGTTLLRNNVFDHSSSGGKFCVIVGEDYKEGEKPDLNPHKLIVENNVFKGSNFRKYPVEGAHNPNSTTGMYVKSSINDLIIKGNEFREFENGYGVISFNNYPVSIEDNRFEVASTSVYLASANARVKIRNNEFKNSSTFPVVVVGTNEVVAADNTFYLSPETERLFYFYSKGSLKSLNNSVIPQKIMD